MARPRRDAVRPTAAVAALDSPGEAVERWRDLLFKVALIVVASLWIYAPAYHGDWLWDDDQSITANAVTQSPWSFRDIWVAPPGADYFPLTATGFWIQWQLFGPRPGMGPAEAAQAMEAVKTCYHVVNAILHILGALAFWRLLHVMRLPGAWLGGLLFAVHPVGVESVAWVSELKNTLSQPLFLLGCAAFVQFDDDTDADARWRHYALAVVFFLLAMLAKTSVVMFPFVILAYGWWKWGFQLDVRGVATLLLAGASLGLTVVPEMYWLKALRAGASTPALWTICSLLALLGPITSVALAAFVYTSRRDAGETGDVGSGKTLEQYTLYALPFFWISVVLGLATCYFQWSRAIGQEAIPVGGVASRVATAGMAILFYLWKTVWPFNLLTIYPRWQVDPPKVWQFLPWPIMFAAGWWLWNQRGTAERPTWQRHMIFVLTFFVLMLLPIIGIITISYMRITWVADHFLYTPMLSVLGIAAAGIAAWFARLKSDEKPVALAVGAAFLAMLTYSSFRYSYAWANEEALWPHTIAGHANPCWQGCGCWQAHNRLGAKKFARGDVESAHFHFQNSTRLRPDLGETHNNLGTTHSARAQMAAQQGNQEAAKREMDLAIEQFREACRVTPHVPAIQVNYANSLAASGRFVEAAEQYKQLLDKMPENPAMWNNYGVALFKQGDTEQAIVAFRKALDIDPNLKDAKESLAVATGEKPMPQAPPPPGGQLQLNLPQSPTLGPVPLQR
jgi:Tfp pilus assembly protein PilF